MGVIVLGYPVGSTSSQNLVAEISRLEGELAAIQKVGAAKGCNLPEIGDPTDKKWKPREAPEEATKQ